MAIAEKPIKLTTLRTDSATLERLKVLAGNKPVARYLRQLSLELTKNMPPSLDDLMGGESLTPIKKILEDMNHKINWLVMMSGHVQNRVDAVDASIQGQFDHIDTAMYNRDMKYYEEKYRQEWQEIQNINMDDVEPDEPSEGLEDAPA